MSTDPNAPTPQISTGNRRDERHYEPDADQQVRVAHLTRPDAPLPRHEGTTLAGQESRKPGEPVEDVTVDAARSSVWDARPPEARAFQDVPAGGAPQASPLDDGEAGGDGAWAQGYLGPDETLGAEPGPSAGNRTDGDEPGDHKPPFPPAELVSKRAGG